MDRPPARTAERAAGPAQPPRRASLAAAMAVQSATGFAASAVLLFVPAGTLDWPQGWAFLLLFYLGSEATGVWLLIRDPALLAERMRSPLAQAQRPRDRAVMAVLLAAFAGWIVLMALDARRFGWTSTPLWAQAAGAGLMLCAFGGWVLVLRANRFATTSVRLQAERGQTVIDTGPYALVRHPMYAASLLLMLGAPLLLGSLWGLTGLAVFVPLLAARIRGEEALLREGLAGYDAYARRVRWRLAPRIW